MIFLRGERGLFLCLFVQSFWVLLNWSRAVIPERGPSGAHCKHGVACPLYNSPKPCITKTKDVSRLLAKRRVPDDWWTPVQFMLSEDMFSLCSLGRGRSGSGVSNWHPCFLWMMWSCWQRFTASTSSQTLAWNPSSRMTSGLDESQCGQIRGWNSLLENGGERQVAT